MLRKYFVIGASYVALGIALGAFGAHGLKEIVSEKMLANFETGVRYQMYCALGLMLISLVAGFLKDAAKPLSTSALLVFIGSIIFSGSLYVMALTGITKLGAITPIGGVLMIVGYVYTAITVWKTTKK